MENKIKNVVLLTNVYKDKGLRLFGEVMSYLLSEGFGVRTSDAFADACDPRVALYTDMHELFRGADAAVLIGGDGTILNAAAYAIPTGCPMIGINLGRKGYMAELEPDEYSMLSRLACGDYRIEERMTLRVETEINGTRTVLSENALNDAVVKHATGMRCVDLSLYCDSASVLDCRGDGMVIATPTGSTAYALAAGGPVLDPVLRCINIVPICSVSPAAKPLVFSGNNAITIENVFDRDDHALLSVDGMINVPLPYGGKVICTGAEKSARMIKLKDNKFFSVLRDKIN